MSAKKAKIGKRAAERGALATICYRAVGSGAAGAAQAAPLFMAIFFS